MDYKKQIETYFEIHREELVQDVMALIRIDSTRGAAVPGMPYGPGPRQALDAALALARQAGFPVRLYDDCVGTAELAAGPRGLDILAHLDVVPVEDNWTACPPFEPKVVDGRLYGRGAQDDKGPAVAALYAMRCIKELGLPLGKTVRLVLGTDEECGSSDLPHYYAKEEEAPVTISPDADFPLINLEKGQMWGEIRADFVPSEALPRLKRLQAGSKTNVVPASGTAVVEGLCAAQAEPIAQAVTAQTGVRFTLQQRENELHIRAEGVGAHAATPQHGNNALTGLLTLLARLPLAPSAQTDAVQALSCLFPHGDWQGQALGIAQADPVAGELTISLNLLQVDAASLCAMSDSRVPLCATEENCAGAFQRACEAAGLRVEHLKQTPVHHVPADRPFIQALLHAYTDWTGRPGQCLSIGGGTYVHDLKNGVAFGCSMPGTDYHIHDADEFIPVEELVLSAKILTQAILTLCQA